LSLTQSYTQELDKIREKYTKILEGRKKLAQGDIAEELAMGGATV
jgi:hypothetical protein